MTKKAKPVWTQTKGRRTPRPNGKVEGELNGLAPTLEVQSNQTAPVPVEPSVVESVPRRPDPLDPSRLPPSMRQAYLSRRVDEDYRGV